MPTVSSFFQKQNELSDAEAQDESTRSHVQVDPGSYLITASRANPLDDEAPSERVLRRRSSIKETAKETAVKAENVIFQMAVTPLFFRDLPNTIRSQRHVRCHATVLFFVLMTAFLAVVTVSCIRLSNDDFDLQSYESYNKVPHVAPRICVRAQNASSVAFEFEARTYINQGAVKIDVPIETVQEEVPLGDGVNTATLTCTKPDDKFHILGRFESPEYKFISIKTRTTAATVETAQSGFIDLWVADHALPQQRKDDQQWRTFHTYCGNYLSLRSEFFFADAHLEVINKLSATAYTMEFPKFFEVQTRYEGPLPDLEESMSTYYIRSSEQLQYITQRQYSIIDAASVCGGMWSGFLLVASAYLIAYIAITARRMCKSRRSRGHSSGAGAFDREQSSDVEGSSDDCGSSTTTWFEEFMDRLSHAHIQQQQQRQLKKQVAKLAAAEKQGVKNNGTAASNAVDATDDATTDIGASVAASTV